jgi:hypothetical protein
VWEGAGYTFASGYHGKPIVNGYSGFFPAHYLRLKEALVRLPADADADAWKALLASGATHAIVHEGGYDDDTSGSRVSGWLRASGARQVATFGRDRVFALR